MPLADPLAERLRNELSALPIIDPHTHIDARRPAARSLEEILSYHYYTELAHSAGMPRRLFDAETPGDERMAALIEHLARFDNTVQYGWLLEIARAFFDFDAERITPRNWTGLAERVARETSRPDWEAEVFRRSNLERVMLTNDFDDPLDGFDTRRYLPCLRADDLVFKLDQPATVRRLAGSAEMAVGDAASLVRGIERRFEHFSARGAKACAISLPPDFTPRAVSTISADPPLRKLLAGYSVSSADRRLVQQFVFWKLAETCDHFGLPFDLMIGPLRGVYREGVAGGQDLFNQLTSLAQYRELFNQFPQVTFPVSVLSSMANQELVAFSWIFPNVVTHGHWWYSNLPAYIAPDLRARLQGVPKMKQVGYYSDMYKLEFHLPKFNMYRQVLAGVLAEDCVRARGWSEERALELGRLLLRDNVRAIFRLSE